VATASVGAEEWKRDNKWQSLDMYIGGLSAYTKCYMLSEIGLSRPALKDEH
jgi:hypothetical protein